MATFDRVLGRKSAPFDPAILSEKQDGKTHVLIDVGTGQGMFILDTAREQPDWLCIGIDAAADNMVKAARTASASPKKGGLDNALFVRGAAEKLPGPFENLADTLTVQYPWGSLMGIVSAPDPAGLAALRAVSKDQARLSVLLNYSVFEDREYLERLGFGDVIDPAESEALIPTYAAAGFKVTQREIFHGDPPVRTAWGRHLVRGSARSTLMIEAAAV